MDQPNGRFRLTLEKEQWTVWYQWHDSKEKKWEKLYSFEVRNHEADEFLPACRKYENDRDPLCHFMSTNPIIMLRVSNKVVGFPNDSFREMRIVFSRPMRGRTCTWWCSSGTASTRTWDRSQRG